MCDYNWSVTVHYYSQRMNEAPARPWVASLKNGAISCVHCNCMAGAGEACSHIGALLYAIMAGVHVRDETACTSVACSWLAPTGNGSKICPCLCGLISSHLFLCIWAW